MEQEWKYIYSVYKNGSFSKAANELFITQPALSIAVSKVESRIGMPLFDRSSKPLQLTKAGEYYIRKYHEIRNLELELDQQLNDLTSLQTGTLRIGGSHYFNAHVLPPFLTEYTKKYPGIRLSLTEAGAESLLQLLDNHEIDITFNCTENPKDSFRRIPCFTDHLVLSVPKAIPLSEELLRFALTEEDILAARHLDSTVSTVPLSAFSDLPFIVLTPGNDLHGRTYRMFSEAGITPHIVMEINQLATAWYLSAAGMGATLVPDFLVRGTTAPVRFFALRSGMTTRVFDLTMSDRRYVSGAMQAFQDLMLRSQAGHEERHMTDSTLRLQQNQ